MAVPRISVLLPARNAQATIEAAVCSVLRQSWEDFELIAVDDGSADATGAILGRLAAEDARLRVVSTPPGGLVAALNLALELARGELIARMDADDESLPERFARSVAALDADPDLAAVGTSVMLFRDDRPVSPSLQAYASWLNGLVTAEQVRTERFIESPLCHPSAMLRTSVLRRLGGWREGPFPEDYELWLRILEGGGRLRNLPEVLFRWRDHDARVTWRDPRYARRRFHPLKARFLARELRGREAVIAGGGPNGMQLLRALRSEGVGVTTVVEVSRRRIGQRAQGVRFVAWDELGPPLGRALIGAVGIHGAREEIRAEAAARGWLEGEDFFCAA